MPAQTATSADKSRAAQAARRQAAQRSAADRRSRPSPSAPVAVAAQARPVSSAPTASSQPADRLADLCSMVESDPSALGPDTSSVRQLCRNRRQNMASQGKTAVAGQTSSARPTRPQRPAPMMAPNPATLDQSADDASPEATAELDMICELVEANPGALGQDANSIRQICRNRRQALANKGKAAMSGKRRTASRASVAASFLNPDVDGREAARKHRQAMAMKGRGNSKAARPSGRVRPSAAPPKVETGTTLSGSPVTGTQVERKATVTGNEPGTCRTVTGTEYIGTEQFASFCGSKPKPTEPPKVGFSVTSGGLGVSGTEVGRSAKVTGDEQGACRSVTGTEYLGAERFAEFCENKGLAGKPPKVMSSMTERKQISVTGADEARFNRTTGTEAGAKRSITGSQYADTGMAKMTINGPAKVALTHTIAGRPVTGTEVGRSSRVTGDEQGSCRTITGTEYISNEQFASICQTMPQPSPAKVGIDRTRRDQVITGNLVDRSSKVTGNEPGSCKRVTGAQYDSASRKLCGGAPPKAHSMHTLAGRELTGTRVDHGPKLSGDEHGGCLPVTGTEYYGQEQFAGYCASTPPATPAKVGVEHTPNGQHVSGTLLSNTASVTGNEAGSHLPVSGTPYAGIQVPENHGACCSACAARDLAIAAGLIAPEQDSHQHTPAPAMQQPEPQPMPISAPAALHGQYPQAYYPQQQVAPQPAPMMMAQPQYPVYAAQPQPEPTAPTDFSIVSPARAAQKRGSQSAITGNSYDGNSRVTGPVNLGGQWVSGTPEFRHTHMTQPQQVMIQPQPAAPAPMQAPATAPTPVQASLQHPAEGMAPAPVQRITGEGRDGGISITGDNWARGHQITGTEGRSAQGRNPTLRCEARGAAFNAHVNRNMERVSAAMSAITGSSGNTHQGAVITVSGGARG
ncbi:CsoS2 family carboxysome shell protein [Thiothrix nivea]|uniref:Carboxysome shell protein CsoS2 n=1 Tax=Thiothrix nivea (strain ATCC 35100 / DSM 5205 / JP2) TaxID=870187 RepID=A0A656HC51_THINJ|nr:CsoS2 family carboxysome shell protein [Thiothrix nivea]EIJ34448.1 carboxysome shell protein CsoS2 [Thiothrix nivea DSM 5205]